VPFFLQGTCGDLHAKSYGDFFLTAQLLNWPVRSNDLPTVYQKNFEKGDELDGSDGSENTSPVCAVQYIARLVLFTGFSIHKMYLDSKEKKVFFGVQYSSIHKTYVDMGWNGRRLWCANFNPNDCMPTAIGSICALRDTRLDTVLTRALFLSLMPQVLGGEEAAKPLRRDSSGRYRACFCAQCPCSSWPAFKREFWPHVSSVHKMYVVIGRNGKRFWLRQLQSQRL
jgi:hypothetical protein